MRKERKVELTKLAEGRGKKIDTVRGEGG